MTRLVFKKLEWTEIKEPNGNTCFYHHVIAWTSFGNMIITWKDWKEHKQFDLEFNAINKSLESNNLVFAKEEAQKLFDSMLLKCFE